MRWHLKRKQQCLYIQLRVACDLRRLQSGCYCLAVLFVSMHVRCVCSFYAVGVKTQTSCAGFLAWAPAIPATVPLDVITLQASTFECCVRTSWDINCGRQELRCPSSEELRVFCRARMHALHCGTCLQQSLCCSPMPDQLGNIISSFGIANVTLY